jgi:hypothetical protein
MRLQFLFTRYVFFTERYVCMCPEGWGGESRTAVQFFARLLGAFDVRPEQTNIGRDANAARGILLEVMERQEAPQAFEKQENQAQTAESKGGGRK